MAKYRKLGRTSDQRKALLRSQVTSLLYRGKIVTTEAKAKEIRKIAEGLIAMAVPLETVPRHLLSAVNDHSGQDRKYGPCSSPMMHSRVVWHHPQRMEVLRETHFSHHSPLIA